METPAFALSTDNIKGDSPDVDKPTVQTNDPAIPMTTWRILKNAIIVSFSILLLFTAYLALQSLETSLNREDGLGMF
jgi:hypothetical protein